MRVVGEIPAKGRSFEELLFRLGNYSRESHRKLLKTANSTGCLVDYDLITLMGGEERSEIAKQHIKLLSSGDAYVSTQELNLRQVLPTRLGAGVKTAEYAGRGKEYSLVLLKGGGVEHLVEARAFLTLRRRHPGALWRFARGSDSWKKPVVLLEDGGMDDGSFLGAVSPVCVKGVVNFGLLSPAPLLKLQSEGNLRYVEHVPN